MTKGELAGSGAAEAGLFREGSLIAALKRCATQNLEHFNVCSLPRVAG
jgi:hypothetical protein